MAPSQLIFVTHPEVIVDPVRPIPEWGLSGIGRSRARAFARSGSLASVSVLWSSAERKAQETAAILAGPLGIAVATDPELGENDRSATGFLPLDAFERAADAFFARPDESVRGWETARDAQRRIVSAVRRIAEGHRGDDIAVVSHGGVGTLLYCALAGLPIERRHDQPGQGHYWSAVLPGLAPLHPWRSIG